MSQSMSYDLSDCLKKLAGHFAEFEHSGVELGDRAVTRLREQLTTLACMAAELEEEVDRERWAENARRDRAAWGSAIMAELSRPGTNLHLFPIVARPFSDGRPHGGAA